MRLIYFAPQGNGRGAELREIVQQSLPRAELEGCEDTETLCALLSEPGAGETVTVALTRNRGELEALGLLRDLWQRHRLILLLPDHHPETVSLGHRLRPRFLGFADSDVANVGAILRHLRQRLED